MSAQSFDASKGKRRITSMLDKSDIAALESIAQSGRVSLAWVIRDAVRAYLATDRSVVQSTRPGQSSRSDA